MKKYIVLLSAAAFLFAGCDKFKDKKKVAAAQEAAAKAQAKLAGRVVPVAATGKTGSADAALAALLCASPRLMEDIEGSLDLLNALSGEGSDRGELKTQILEFRKRYRAPIENGMTARGATYAEFTRYAAGASTEQKTKFKALVAEKCPRGDKDLVERTADGLMRYYTAAIPK